MWLLASLCLSALCSIAQATPESGFLQLYDESFKGETGKYQTISPDAARLIIASRLGVERYHDIGSGLDAEFAIINEWAPSRPLLAQASKQQPVAVLLAQGPDSNSRNVPQSTDTYNYCELLISPVPKATYNEELLASLAIQKADGTTSSSNIIHDLREGEPVWLSGAVVQKAPSSNKGLSEMIENYRRQEYTVLVLSLPNITTSKATWGTWTLPQSAAHNHKRQNIEELLEPDVTTPSFRISATVRPNAASNSSSNSSAPLRGILPQCFSSQATCESITRNCTGHGSCKLKYTDRDASSSGAPCYSCSCTADVRTNSDGTKKTTNWGGPACQKKDVVAPFWLLAGFSLIMVSLVSWGIGTIWTMGDEELPSVIGAGVSGPPRR